MCSVLLLEHHFIDLSFAPVAQSKFAVFRILMLLPPRLPSPFPPPLLPLSPVPDLAFTGFQAFSEVLNSSSGVFRSFQLQTSFSGGFEVVYIGFEVVYIGFELFIPKRRKSSPRASRTF